MKQELEQLLAQDDTFMVEGVLNKNKLAEFARQYNPELLNILMSNDKISKYFFSTLDTGVLVFKKDVFLQFLNNKEFLPDSFTAYKTKIGLATGDKYLSENQEVVLNFPYKDCVLEGGQTKDDAKRQEIFFNETLAQDEITELLDPKVLTNVKLFDKDGEKDFNQFNRNENGTITDNLIIKEDKKGETLEANKQDAITTAFKSQLPKMDKVEFNVMTQALGENSAPVMITQSEYMRRMKEMANIQAGMSFYGEMPDMFNLILNSDHKLIKQVLNEEENACQAEVAPILSEMDNVNKQRNELKDKQKDKKEEDIPTAEKDELNDLDKKWDDLKSKKEAIFIGYASNNKVIRQLIDLALLQNNMLRGEALNNFVKRSIELI